MVHSLTRQQGARTLHAALHGASMAAFKALFSYVANSAGHVHVYTPT